MNNEEGRSLKIGDVVWTIGAFEHLTSPFLVSEGPYEEYPTIPSMNKWGIESRNKSGKKNVFVKITYWLPPGMEMHYPRHEERMNVFFLSREHPLGWIFLIPGTPDYSIFMKAKEQNK